MSVRPLEAFTMVKPPPPTATVAQWPATWPGTKFAIDEVVAVAPVG